MRKRFWSVPPAEQAGTRTSHRRSQNNRHRCPACPRPFPTAATCSNTALLTYPSEWKTLIHWVSARLERPSESVSSVWIKCSRIRGSEGPLRHPPSSKASSKPATKPFLITGSCLKTPRIGAARCHLPEAYPPDGTERPKSAHSHKPPLCRRRNKLL